LLAGRRRLDAALLRGSRSSQPRAASKETSHARDWGLIALVLLQLVTSFGEKFIETAAERALKIPAGDALSVRQKSMDAESSELFQRVNDLTTPTAEADCAAVQIGAHRGVAPADSAGAAAVNFTCACVHGGGAPAAAAQAGSSGPSAGGSGSDYGTWLTHSNTERG
jgi:hypothetical protein